MFATRFQKIRVGYASRMTPLPDPAPAPPGDPPPVPIEPPAPAVPDPAPATNGYGYRTACSTCAAMSASPSRFGWPGYDGGTSTIALTHAKPGSWQASWPIDDV